jgi:hypothetical protein
MIGMNTGIMAPLRRYDKIFLFKQKNGDDIAAFAILIVFDLELIFQRFCRVEPSAALDLAF